MSKQSCASIPILPQSSPFDGRECGFTVIESRALEFGAGESTSGVWDFLHPAHQHLSIGNIASWHIVGDT
jgi:hypothetical protein